MDDDPSRKTMTMAKRSRQALQEFSENLNAADIEAALDDDVFLSLPQRFSYERKVREEGYTGTPARYLIEQRAETAALVKRLEKAEKDVVPNQIQDLREAVEERHEEVLTELKVLRSEIQGLREVVMILARERPQQQEDELIDSGERDYWDAPILVKRSSRDG
jgi:hypothetical protein